MQREIVKASDAKSSVDGIFDKFQDKFRASLPASVSFDRAFQIARNCVKGNRDIMECDPISILSGVMTAMELGLVLDGVMGQAYLVAFNNRKKGVKEAQFIPGYKGLMELAYRTGKVTSIQAKIVREGDYFEWEDGTDSFLKHRAAGDSSKEITHVWGMACLKTGEKPFEVMTKEEIDAIRKGASGGRYGPWVDHYEEMARKTVIRRLCKYLPASVELQTAVGLADRADAGMSPPDVPESLLEEALPVIGQRVEEESDPVLRQLEEDAEKHYGGGE